MSRHEYLIEGETLETRAEKSDKSANGYVVTVGELSFEIEPQAPGLFSVLINGRKKTIAAVSSNGTTYIDIDSVLLELQEPSEDGFGGAGGDHAAERDKIFAPMPGKVVKLLVAVGDVVEAKQATVIVEAMKMENPVLAAAKGTVTAINFDVGDQVDTDNPIIELELDE